MEAYAGTISGLFAAEIAYNARHGKLAHYLDRYLAPPPGRDCIARLAITVSFRDLRATPFQKDPACHEAGRLRHPAHQLLNPELQQE